MASIDLHWRNAGESKWEAYHGTSGEPVGVAVLTGRPGVDNYPWDWYLTDAGEKLVPPEVTANRRWHQSGVSDTLRASKDMIRQALFDRR